jgi:hypothetical protein
MNEPNRAGGNALTTTLLVALLVLTAIAGYFFYRLVRMGEEARAVPATVVGGIATQVQEIIHPTPTIYPDPVTVIKEVRALSRLETAQYTVEKVITAETGQGVFRALFGDRLLFVAHGQVIAGVDLSRIQQSDISAAPDGRVTVIVPAAEVFVATLDNDKSYVYDRNTGLLTKGDVNLETQARQVAEDEIEKAALEDGILNTAQENAATFLKSLLLSFGFRDVIIVQATPVP